MFDSSSVDDVVDLAALVDQHGATLSRYAVTLTDGDREWAEDVVQEAFIRAWRHLDRMTPERGSVRSWLFRVAHNLAVDGHRARRACPAESDQIEARIECVPDASGQVLDSIEVADALAELTGPQRDVLIEIYLRDRSFHEAARRLRVPVGTVKSRTFYALRQLRASHAMNSRVG